MNRRRWELKEYEGGFFKTFYDLCDQDTQEVLDRRLDLLLEKGNLAKRPISAPLREGIFELRANQARILFCFMPGRIIVILHAIIKKKGRVPNRDIELAIRRRTIIEEDGDVSNAIYH